MRLGFAGHENFSKKQGRFLIGWIQLEAGAHCLFGSRPIHGHLGTKGERHECPAQLKHGLGSKTVKPFDERLCPYRRISRKESSAGGVHLIESQWKSRCDSGDVGVNVLSRQSESLAVRIDRN